MSQRRAKREVRFSSTSKSASLIFALNFMPFDFSRDLLSHSAVISACFIDFSNSSREVCSSQLFYLISNRFDKWVRVLFDVGTNDDINFLFTDNIFNLRQDRDFFIKFYLI